MKAKQLIEYWRLKMSKGSVSRPFTDRKKFEEEFDRIFKKGKNETVESIKRKPTESSKKTK